ncbi:MAG: hypothetical protein PHX13_11545 [Thiovulaceae bacterium]|nr:hypothetical protein [Sulfurimonadaceae bacterium]
MLTDGPGTPGNGHWEINTAITGEIKNDSKRYELPVIDINYGLGDTIQLKVETNNVYLDTEGQKTSGIANTLAGVKWRFYDHDGLMISIYPQLGFAPVESSFHKGLSEYNNIAILPLEITKQFGPLWITGEIGYEQIDHAVDRMKYGVICGYDVNEDLTLMTEIYSDQKWIGNDETRSLNFGLTYKLNNQFGLLCSLGKELKSPEQQHATLFYSGLQILF